MKNKIFPSPDDKSKKTKYFSKQALTLGFHVSLVYGGILAGYKLANDYNNEPEERFSNTILRTSASVDEILKAYTNPELEHAKIHKYSIYDIFPENINSIDNAVPEGEETEDFDAKRDVLVQKIIQKNKHILKDFDFLHLASTLDPEIAKQKYRAIFYHVLGMFPSDTLKKNLTILYISPIDSIHRTKDDNVIGIAHSRLKFIKLHPHVIPAEESEDNEEKIFILYSTVFHEIMHTLFEHSHNDYWMDRWEKETGRYIPLSSAYAHDYGKTETAEDMATIGTLMFSSDWLRELDEKGKKHPMIVKKIRIMKDFFFEVSNGQMNEEYWKRIYNDEIFDAIDAQKFFAEQKEKHAL